jgi:hypothetical protein
MWGRELRAGHLGYVLGPRLNAVGRIGDAADGLRLLLSDEPEEAIELIHRESLKILEDVGTVVVPSRPAGLPQLLDELRVVARPLILGKEMLVRVYKGKRADLMTKIGLRLHRRLPSLSVSRALWTPPSGSL